MLVNQLHIAAIGGHGVKPQLSTSVGDEGDPIAIRRPTGQPLIRGIRRQQLEATAIILLFDKVS